MAEATEAVWIKFFETPIAMLEDYGASNRVLFAIEQRYGIYVKHLQGIEEQDLMNLPNCGPRMIVTLRLSLRRLFDHLVDQEKQRGLRAVYEVEEKTRATHGKKRAGSWQSRSTTTATEPGL